MEIYKTNAEENYYRIDTKETEMDEFVDLATPLMDYLNNKFGTASFQYEILITDDKAKLMQTYFGCHSKREF